MMYKLTAYIDSSDGQKRAAFEFGHEPSENEMAKAIRTKIKGLPEKLSLVFKRCWSNGKTLFVVSSFGLKKGVYGTAELEPRPEEIEWAIIDNERKTYFSVKCPRIKVYPAIRTAIAYGVVGGPVEYSRADEAVEMSLLPSLGIAYSRVR